jgi:hypothetical protein
MQMEKKRHFYRCAIMIELVEVMTKQVRDKDVDVDFISISLLFHHVFEFKLISQ